MNETTEKLNFEIPTRGVIKRSFSMVSIESEDQFDEEGLNLMEDKNHSSKHDKKNIDDGKITTKGLQMLVLLALLNCSKNLLSRFVMARNTPKFLLSAAVIGSELTKLIMSILYIVLVERRSFASILDFLQKDWRNTILLLGPATSYSIQQTLEYVALANIDVALFSVLVQSKLLFTALFAVLLLRKKLRKAQVISLVILTIGVILCNLKDGSEDEMENQHRVKGIMATLGVASCSGVSSVYTEKVIKKHRKKSVSQFSLAYMQVQLASASLFMIGSYAVVKDFSAIRQGGLWQNFDMGVIAATVNTGIGGLSVAAVLKYADSVIKCYATAVSVILSGILSVIIFGTTLSNAYFLGIVNVISSVILYNASGLDELMC